MPAATFKPPLPALCLAMLFALAAIAAGCATAEQSPGARAPATGARDAQPDMIAITANNFRDTDGNRFRDTAEVIVYLFAGDNPIPVLADGMFTFVLEGSDTGRRLAEWRFEPEQVQRAVIELGPGPGYHFELSLFDAHEGSRSDRLNETRGELLVTFTPVTPPEARPVRRRGTPLQIGPIGRSGVH